jgi:uncharacterized protein (TIGR02611 family)
MAATLQFSFRKHWRDLKRGQPGRRFQDSYQRARKREAGSGAMERIILIVAALVCFLIGVVLTFIPGPAILFFFLGGGLLATESRWVARKMDWIEVRCRRLFSWAARRWHRLPLAGRVGLGIFATAAVALAAYWAYRLFLG